jgi:cytoskeletal protein CcmA (bactofilin family)
VFEKIISKNSDEGTPPPPPPAARTGSSAQSVGTSYGGTENHRNVLLPDVEIKGIVRFEDDLIVKGKIDGEIHSAGALTIGETAKIKAEIKTGSVIVNGKVHGNITATESVDLQQNAEVIGDISSKTLTMAAGAVFVGISTVGAPAGASSSAKAPPQANKGKAPAAPSSS